MIIRIFDRQRSQISNELISINRINRRDASEGELKFDFYRLLKLIDSHLPQSREEKQRELIEER